MAGFHEVQFPTDISAGATGGPGFHTTILTLASGFEQRNVDWAKARAMYDVGHGARDDEQIAALVNFHNARRGRAYGFRFKDWLDFRAPFWKETPGDIYVLPTLFTTDGSTATFQLTKSYGDAGGTYVRTITKPVAGTLLLYDNNSPPTALTTPGQYTYSTTTGIVTLAAAIKNTTGHPITGSFEFDVPVRFDTDELNAEIIRRGLAAFNGVKLVEVRV